MSKKLLIVESPGKIKTLEKILGPEYIVKASYGHIRQLDKKTLGIDTDDNYNGSKPHSRLQHHHRRKTLGILV